MADENPSRQQDQSAKAGMLGFSPLFVRYLADDCIDIAPTHRAWQASRLAHLLCDEVAGAFSGGLVAKLLARRFVMRACLAF